MAGVLAVHVAERFATVYRMLLCTFTSTPSFNFGIFAYNIWGYIQFKERQTIPLAIAHSVALYARSLVQSHLRQLKGIAFIVTPLSLCFLSDSYMCHHYERDTCLIHFKCCPEEFWFACHKCHNEALGLIENLDEKGPENEEPAIDHSDVNYTRATNISGEMEDNSNQAETSSEPEGAIAWQ